MSKSRMGLPGADMVLVANTDGIYHPQILLSPDFVSWRRPSLSFEAYCMGATHR